MAKNPLIYIDYSFDQNQTPSTFQGIKKQLQECHSYQFKSKNPLNLVITNIKEELLKEP
jgi:hypothetical protein